MDKFFKKAFEFVQEDPGLLSISVDIRKMLSPLIQAQKHGAILQILDMIQSNKINNESLFYLKSLCLLREKNFKDSEISILSALLIDKNKNSGKQKENFEALYLEIKENEQFFDKLVQLYELPEEKDDTPEAKPCVERSLRHRQGRQKMVGCRSSYRERKASSRLGAGTRTPGRVAKESRNAGETKP